MIQNNTDITNQITFKELVRRKQNKSDDLLNESIHSPLRFIRHRKSLLTCPFVNSL